LLDGIQSDNQTVIAAKTTIMMNDAMRTSFQVAVNCLSKFIGAAFSGNTTYNSKQVARNISWMETGRGRGRGGCAGRGGREYGRSAQGSCPGGKQHNGVDITDLTRNFTAAEEWQKLSLEVIRQIKNAREAAKSENKKRKAAVVSKATLDETAHKEQATADPSWRRMLPPMAMALVTAHTIPTARSRLVSITTDTKPAD
jgi:hypothetical protein